jgi:Universal stress protein UspA and related nucleotide-binding proteins
MYRTIVFAYDGSAECRDALAGGIVLASRFNARCYLLAAVQPLTPLALSAVPLPEELMAEELARLTSVLDEGVERLRQAGLEATGSLKMGDTPAETIGAFAGIVDADLVIVGHHRRSAIKRWWHGSVGHFLLDHVPCSLLVSMPRAQCDGKTGNHENGIRRHTTDNEPG